MKFQEWADNSNLIERLEQIVRRDKISHAYILEGPAHVDKRAFAESFIKGILCQIDLGENCGKCSICNKVDHRNHEDIMYLSADGSSVKDAAILSMQEKLKSKPLGERHIVIVEDSDTMTRRAQNRLLKTLEEPPGRCVIILLSENMEKLLPTVRSRCVKYRINHFGSGGCDSMMDKAAIVADMTIRREPFYKVKKEIDGISGSRQDSAALLDALETVYRNIMLEKGQDISLYRDEVIIRNIHNVEMARKMIQDGVSANFAMKNLLLKIGG